MHEMIGVDSESRNAVDFKDLFMCRKGATPSDLVERGIYSQIAIPLKGGEWRQQSIAMVLSALNKGIDPKPQEVRSTRLPSFSTASAWDKTKSALFVQKLRKSSAATASQRLSALETSVHLDLAVLDAIARDSEASCSVADPVGTQGTTARSEATPSHPSHAPSPPNRSKKRMFRIRLLNFCKRIGTWNL